jgi:predicted DNA-binding transcriptional regulator YafY
MKRSDRINSMLMFLNDKNYFHLKDIMSRYEISKSTALRDIQSLEELGMPIYSEPGRYGRYVILKNKLLSPIIFTEDEMNAMYFAMLTLESYQSTPFHLNVPYLKDKFEESISKDKIGRLKKMDEVLQMENTRHFNSSPFLKEIVEAAIDQTVVEITYLMEDREITAHVQFHHINSRFGQWYVTAYNLQTHRFRVYRCDRITRLAPSTHFEPLSREVLEQELPTARSKKTGTPFTVEITKKGLDLFYKENYPSMTLVEEEGRFFINGYYEANEEIFMARYFLNYGDTVLKISPVALQQNIEALITELGSYYSKRMRSDR